MKYRPTAKDITYQDGEFTVFLTNGGRVRFPANDYYLLRNATEAQRSECEIEEDGEGLHWPTIDEDLYVPTLIEDYKVEPALVWNEEEAAQRAYEKHGPRTEKSDQNMQELINVLDGITRKNPSMFSIWWKKYAPNALRRKCPHGHLKGGWSACIDGKDVSQAHCEFGDGKLEAHFTVNGYDEEGNYSMFIYILERKTGKVARIYIQTEGVSIERNDWHPAINRYGRGEDYIADKGPSKK